MGREVRRVPASWQHPKTARFNISEPGQIAERYLPLLPYDCLVERIQALKSAFAEVPTSNERMARFTEIMADYEPKGDYMPNFPPGTATHYMMYETCSEGTPISPAFSTPEALAGWLADTGASVFGDMTATYEEWLRIAGGSPSVGLMVSSAGFTPAIL